MPCIYVQSLTAKKQGQNVFCVDVGRSAAAATVLSPDAYKRDAACMARD